MWSRIHLIPMLQAEEDRDVVRRHWADKARERELTGGEMKVYHGDRQVLNSITDSGWFCSIEAWLGSDDNCMARRTMVWL